MPIEKLGVATAGFREIADGCWFSQSATNGSLPKRRVMSGLSRARKMRVLIPRGRVTKRWATGRTTPAGEPDPLTTQSG